MAFRFVSLQVAPLSVPTIDPFRIATGEVTATRSIAVTVTIEQDGREAEGLAEGSCLPPVTREDQPDAQRAVERAIPTLVGRHLEDLPALEVLLDDLLGTTLVARSAVEVATLSALATLQRVPLWKFLSPSLPAAPRIETDITIPILAPQRMAELATSWWQQGFRAFKIKVGRNIEDDLVSLAAMAKVAPLAVFQPDANAGLTPREALRYAEAAAAAGLRLSCFEQPCASMEGLREVKEALSVPVIADESLKTMADLDALLEADAAGAVNLKIAKTGSLLRCLEIGRAARAQGLGLMVGGMVETRLGMAAAAHLAAALGGVEFADLDTAWLLREDPFTGGYRSEHPTDANRPGPIYCLDDATGVGLGVKWRTSARPSSL